MQFTLSLLTFNILFTRSGWGKWNKTDGSLREVCKEGSEDDDLLGRPVILHKPRKPKQMKPAGNYALLRCTAIGDPLPRFQWFKVRALYIFHVYCSLFSRLFVLKLRFIALLQDGMEILQDKSLASIAAKYVIRSTVLAEDDLNHANALEGIKSTLQISDLRGSDTANVT